MCWVKLVCTQKALAEGLATVERAVPTKSPLPVLSNVLLQTDERRLKLVANNLEMAISAWVAANVAEEGAVTLPARLLGDFVASLGGGDIQMEIKPGTRTMHLACGRFEANINGIDADDFPAAPAVGDGSRCRIAAKTLRTAITQVVFAAAADETRPVLSGVLVTIDGSELTMAAADGFRLAVRAVSLADPVAEKLTLLAPARTLNELARIIPDSEDPVEITATHNRNQVVFQFPASDSGRAPTLLVVGRLIEGQFPDYQRIIPQSYQTRVVVPVSDLLQATKTASVFSRDNSNIVRISATPSGDELVPGRVDVLASSAEMGDNAGQLDGSVEGDAVQIAFNGRYLREALEAVHSGEVALEITSPTSPGLVKPLAGPGHLHVIMPMHVAR
ncbi:MAG: DNA polymerase III subunit beta [Chloroflexi bacterium]|nr:DNA polymerase III subunit beta [Chloroflexota bacterium]